MSTIDRLGVIGGGSMGAGITEVGARAGLSVVNVGVSKDAADAAAVKVHGTLRKVLTRQDQRA